MVTEVAEIIIRERGAAATSRRIDRVGKSSRTARRAVLGLVAAIGSIVAVRALAGLAKDAIAASAAFEGYQVRLTNLLGSQEEANEALETFVDLSTKTPFAVADIVAGATTLAASALGNRDALEELTQTASNLAAVTGLSFQEAASNLARSLQAGIGAADLFRERGVRALIEEIQGIPDATKLTAKELDEAFKSVFGEGGTFGDAAEALANTLGGALSNIGDAAANFKVSLGDAFSPTVINAAKKIFIPFFQNLQALVVANSEDINDLVAGALSGLISAFVLTAQAGLALAETFGTIRKFVRDFIGTLLEVNLQLANANRAIGEFFDFGEVNALTTKFIERQRLAREAVDNFATGAREGDLASEKFKERLDGINDSLGTLQVLTSAANLSAAIPKLAGGPTAEQLRGAEEREKRTAEELKKQEKSERELAKLSRAILLDRESGGDPLERQRILIDEQIAKVVRLTDATGDQVLQEQLVNELLRQRTLIGAEAADEDEESRLQIAVRRALEGGVQEALAGGDVLNALAIPLQEALRTNAEKGLEDAITGVVGNLGEAFGPAFDEIGAAMGETFGAIFEGLGEEFGEILGAAVQFAASLALDAIVGGTNAAQRSAVAGVTSQVTSTQAVRGIVAGPQSIAIAQVGDSITSATAPLIDLTLISNSILAEIRDTLSGRGLGASALEPNLAAAAFENGAIG